MKLYEKCGRVDLVMWGKKEQEGEQTCVKIKLQPK